MRGRSSAPSPGLAIVVVTLLVALELLFPRGSRWPEVGWVTLLAGEAAALVILPAALWKRLCDTSVVIGDLLSEKDNEDLARWIERRIHPPMHFGFCIVGTVVGLVATKVADRYVSHHFSVAAYAALALLGFLGFDVIRWIWRAPVVLKYLRDTGSDRDFRINMIAPTHTKSVRQINDLLNQASLRTACGLFILAAPVVWTVLDSSTPKDRIALALISIGPMVISLMTALYVTFVPQTWLSDILRSSQFKHLDQLAGGDVIGDAPSDLTAKLDTTVRLYQTIADAPTRIPSLERTARNAAKVLLAVVPYAATVALKLIQHAHI